MKKLDCLFIHPTTHLKTPYSETKDSVTYTIMPMGTIALADLLDREGYQTRIIHTGIEQMCDRSFSLDSLFKKNEPSVVGIDLHWYVHSYDAIRIANIVKQSSDAFVVLGGFTASFFAREILSRFKNIDAVICGDAEIPLLELLDKHRKNATLEDVPNLMYRDRESLKQSKKRYIAKASDLDQLNFSNFSLLSNFDKYLETIYPSGDLDPFVGKSKIKRQGWLCLGRGCSVNCSYCGGGKDAFQILTARQTPIFRSKEKVVEELARFEEMGISCAYMDFDPYPMEHDYYRELFSLVRREKIDISALFLLWSPSDREFLKDFKDTFSPLYSTICLSPESGSEYIRKLNKGYYYDNQQLFRWLNNAKLEMIPIQLYFTSGLSGETKEHFEDTIRIGLRTIEEYPVVAISCNPIELEPASPRFLFPEKHGVSLKFRQFIDFYNTFKGIAQGVPISSRLGYSTDQLSELQIMELSQHFQETIISAQIQKWKDSVSERRR